MIAETIKLLISNKWYGCGPTIEIAKGKHSIPKTWKEAKEKIRRFSYMQIAEVREAREEKTNTILSWLSRNK